MDRPSQVRLIEVRGSSNYMNVMNPHDSMWNSCQGLRQRSCREFRPRGRVQQDAARCSKTQQDAARRSEGLLELERAGRYLIELFGLFLARCCVRSSFQMALGSWSLARRGGLHGSPKVQKAIEIVGLDSLSVVKNAPTSSRVKYYQSFLRCAPVWNLKKLMSPLW